MIQLSDYVDIKKRAGELGCNIPLSLALLPRNFETAKSKDELVHESTTSTIRILWRQNDIVETKLEKEGEKLLYAQEKAFEWIAPTIFISAALLGQNPHIISVALGVISNYLTEWFRGIPRDNRKVKLRVITDTKSGHYKKVEYEGTPDGLKELPEIIREVYNE